MCPGAGAGRDLLGGTPPLPERASALPRDTGPTHLSSA